LKLPENELPELPASIGSIRSLEELDVSCNKLVKLPATLGNLKELRRLSFGNNQVVSIPDGLFECSNLVSIEAQDNQLTSISARLARMTTRLVTFELGGNPLCPAEAKTRAKR